MLWYKVIIDNVSKVAFSLVLIEKNVKGFFRVSEIITMSLFIKAIVHATRIRPTSQ